MIAVSSLVRFYPVKYQVADGIASRYFSTLHKRGFKFLSCPLRVGWESGVLMRSFETEFTEQFQPKQYRERNGDCEPHRRLSRQDRQRMFPISMRTIKKLLSGPVVHVHAGGRGCRTQTRTLSSISAMCLLARSIFRIALANGFSHISRMDHYLRGSIVGCWDHSETRCSAIR